MTVFSSGVTEIEFTAGVWTDVSSRVSLRSGIRVRQGRPTEFDPIGAGTLQLWLWNDDGALMPDNPSSTYYPNVVENKRIRFKPIKAGVTYTRFVGWIQAIEPDFPTANTTGSMVHITAVDSLGLMAQRKLRSNWTETALWRARTDATHCDAFEATGQANGMFAVLTNYSQDAAPGGANASYSTTLPILSFGTDQNMSIGGVVSVNPDGAGDSCSTLVGFQSGCKEIQFLMKTPTNLVGSSTFYSCATFYTSGPTRQFNLGIDPNGSVNALKLKDAAFVTDLGIIANLPFGQWVMVRIYQNAGTATHIDITCTYELSSFGTSILSNANFDVRNTVAMEIPAGINKYLPGMAWGGIVALGSSTAVDPANSVVAAGGGTTSSRITALMNAINQLAFSWGGVGSGFSQPVANGVWTDRYALDVGQEIMRSANGLLWARPRDSLVCAIAPDALRPASPLMTVDLDGDAVGAPRLTRSVDSRPTRVQVDTPTGSTLVIDSIAESAANGSPQRLKQVTTMNAVTTDAQAVANLLLAQASTTRISQFTIDLNSANSDPTATLFDESTSLGGLWPTQKLRLTVPSSHFGATTKDVLVQGWEEQYDTEGARIVLDTTPSLAAILATETWTGTNGTAWPGQWAAGASGTGAVVDIQGNRGRISAGTAANATTARRLNLAAQADMDWSGTFILNQSQGTMRASWRGDSTLGTDAYYLQVDTSGTLSLRKVVASVVTSLTSWAFTVTPGTAYRFRCKAFGTLQMARVWAATAPEPQQWSGAVVDASQATGFVGLTFINDGVATPRTCDFDDILLTDGK